MTLRVACTVGPASCSRSRRSPDLSRVELGQLEIADPLRERGQPAVPVLALVPRRVGAAIFR